MKKLKLISLFAGIGAVEMGAYRVFDEVEVVAAAEIDKFARQSYVANHKIDDNHFYTDVRELDGNKYKGMADCVSFGFPCQDYSMAGKRAGLDGQRGTLFYEGARIVKEVQPDYFIAENVKGLLSSNGGKDFKVIMDILRNELGYYCHAEVLNTKDYGVPQNRERIYIIGFRDADAYHKFKFSDKHNPTTKEDMKKVFGDEFSHLRQLGRGYNKGGIFTDYSPTVTSNGWQYNHFINSYMIPERQATIWNMLQLQDFPATFFDGIDIPISQKSKQIGNSMSVNVLEMMFRQIQKAQSNTAANTLLDFIGETA